MIGQLEAIELLSLIASRLVVVWFRSVRSFKSLQQYTRIDAPDLSWSSAKNKGDAVVLVESWAADNKLK